MVQNYAVLHKLGIVLFQGCVCLHHPATLQLCVAIHRDLSVQVSVSIDACITLHRKWSVTVCMSEAEPDLHMVYVVSTSTASSVAIPMTPQIRVNDNH